MLRRIDALDLDDFVPPIVTPVAVQPNARRDVPARGPLAGILEDARAVFAVAVAGPEPGSTIFAIVAQPSLGQRASVMRRPLKNNSGAGLTP